MKAPIKNYAKIGTILFMSYLGLSKGDNSEGSLEGIKKICCDDYFDAIEVNWIKDPAARAKAAKLMNDSKITICYGAQPRMLTTGLNINDTNEEKRLECLASLKAGIDEAYEIGASGFAFMSGKYDEATKDQAYAQLQEQADEPEVKPKRAVRPRGTKSAPRKNVTEESKPEPSSVELTVVKVPRRRRSVAASKDASAPDSAS